MLTNLKKLLQEKAQKTCKHPTAFHIKVKNSGSFWTQTKCGICRKQLWGK